jgi:hypothetical protein
VNGALKAAWGLTLFVIVAGVVGWIATGRVVFAFFLLLGLVTAVGAWWTGRNTSSPSKGEAP